MKIIIEGDDIECQRIIFALANGFRTENQAISNTIATNQGLSVNRIPCNCGANECCSSCACIGGAGGER